MSNTNIAEIATKKNFSSINEVVEVIKNSQAPHIVIENAVNFLDAISELEKLAKTYKIEILAQINEANTEKNEESLNETIISKFSGTVVNLFNDSENEDLNDRIKEADLVLYLGLDMDNIQNSLLEKSINTYQITSRKISEQAQLFDETGFNQINSNEVGFIKVLNMMM